MRDGRPEYVDISHPKKGQPHTAIVLWIHDGGGIKVRWRNLLVEEIETP